MTGQNVQTTILWKTERTDRCVYSEKEAGFPKEEEMKMGRAAGVLLAVSSLPGRYGIGCFDQEAYRFVDFLERAGQTYWQILPLNPPNHHPMAYDSPYQSFSTFAGNPYYISLSALIQEGALTREEVDAVDFGSDPEHVDYDKLYERRLPLLRKAYERSHIAEKEDYQRFICENAWWLDDYALFMALKGYFGEEEWPDWPEDISRHWGYAIDYYNHRVDEETRTVSRNRTIAKILAGTAVGALVRGSCFKLIEKTTDIKSKKKFGKSLLPADKDLLKEFSKFAEKLSNYRNALSTFAAIVVMCFTNFLLDAPLTAILTNKFNAKSKEKAMKKKRAVTYV